jgi:predicted dehydrogenase
MKAVRKPMGVAVVGASMRSSLILHYLQRNPRKGRVTGVFDLIPERASYALERFGMKGVKVYRDLDELLNDSQAGAVFVGSPDCAHGESVIPALQSGRHVFCEKPLATTLRDCDAIAKAARKARGVLYLGMNLRHSPVHEAVQRILMQGEIGRPLLVEANEYYYGGRTYFRRWNRLNKHGGGLWITKGTHDFDILNWLTGGTALRVSAFSSLSHYKPRKGAAKSCRDCTFLDTCPDACDINAAKDFSSELASITEKVTGRRRDLCLYNSDKDTFDNGQALIEYDNDIRASYTLSVVASRSTRQISVTGTEGLIEADMGEGVVKLTQRHSGKTVTHDLKPLMNAGHGGADDKLLNDFFDCCSSGRSPKSGWADGRASILVGLAARKSCDTKRTVEVRALDRQLSAKPGRDCAE